MHERDDLPSSGNSLLEADSWFAPSQWETALFCKIFHSGHVLYQWETTLHCNVVSHWLSPYSEWSLEHGSTNCLVTRSVHDDVIKWKHFTRYWPFVRGIHRSPVNSPHKNQWNRALMFSLIRAWINRWVNNCEAGDLRRHRALYDVIVMIGRQYTPVSHQWKLSLTLPNSWLGKIKLEVCRTRELSPK